ncbi:MAG TPA: ParB N-terminal domain-containing protein [Paracoccus sp. (in: a-proteobacteria)]|nr:ParB N-terminal domain-containing protein [Paracoccus sp. (in: a-proteobacteria)]
MNEIETQGEVQDIPIEEITVENPRERSEKTFRALVDSIGKVGLKKPITVARDDHQGYRLVCGQGRMEAYLALGETRIPAIIVDANEIERLLRSIIENIARRQQRPLELLQDISTLRDRGYSIDLSLVEDVAKADIPKKVTNTSPRNRERLPSLALDGVIYCV